MRERERERVEFLFFIFYFLFFGDKKCVNFINMKRKAIYLEP